MKPTDNDVELPTVTVWICSLCKTPRSYGAIDCKACGAKIHDVYTATPSTRTTAAAPLDASKRAKEIVGNIHNYYDEENDELSWGAFSNLTRRIASALNATTPAQPETPLAVTPESIVYGVAKRDPRYRKWLIEQLTALGDKIDTSPITRIAAPEPPDLAAEAELRLRAVACAARDFIWEPENWEAWQDAKESNSVAWPPEFLMLAQAVEKKFGPMPIDDDDKEPTNET